MSLANTLLGIVFVLILTACSAPPKAGGGKGETLYTENLPPGTAEGPPTATLPDSRCTKQLKEGYALRERIDREYAQSRIAGTFRGRRDEFMARWVKETGQWAAETKTVLLQIGGPTAKSRFQNAQTPIGMVSGDVGWNNIRNYLRTRLAALESICKGP